MAFISLFSLTFPFLVFFRFEMNNTLIIGVIVAGVALLFCIIATAIPYWWKSDTYSIGLFRNCINTPILGDVCVDSEGKLFKSLHHSLCASAKKRDVKQLSPQGVSGQQLMHLTKHETCKIHAINMCLLWLHFQTHHLHKCGANKKYVFIYDFQFFKDDV